MSLKRVSAYPISQIAIAMVLLPLSTSLVRGKEGEEGAILIVYEFDQDHDVSLMGPLLINRQTLNKITQLCVS